MKVSCYDLSSLEPSLTNYYNFSLSVYQLKSCPNKPPLFKVICFYSVDKKYSSAFSIALPSYNYFVYSQGPSKCFVVLTKLSNPKTFQLLDNFNLVDICVLSHRSSGKTIQYCFYDLYDRSSIACLLSELDLFNTIIFTGIARVDPEWFTRYESISSFHNSQCYVSYPTDTHHLISYKSFPNGWLLSTTSLQN